MVKLNFFIIIIIIIIIITIIINFNSFINICFIFR